MNKRYLLSLLFLMVPLCGMKRRRADDAGAASTASTAGAAYAAAAAAASVSDAGGDHGDDEDYEPKTPVKNGAGGGATGAALLRTPSSAIPKEQWSAGILFSQSEDVLDAIARAIDAIPTGGFIGAADKYFRNHKIIDALIAAKKRGVEVIVQVGQGAQAYKVQQLRNAHIQVQSVKGLHTKKYIMSEKGPDIFAEDYDMNAWGKCTIFVGSHNNSYVAPGHHEDMVVYHDAGTFAEQYWSLVGDYITSPVKGAKQPLTVTPAKRTLTSSQRFSGTGSLAHRIAKLQQSDHEDDMLDITSLTFNADTIVTQVEQLKAQRPSIPIRFILDRLALTNKQLLDRLVAAGARVYIYNQDGAKKVFGKYPQLQHMKNMLRRVDGEYLTAVSTGNLTSNSDYEINHISWHPCDKKLFDAIKNQHDELIAQCDQYSG